MKKLFALVCLLSALCIVLCSCGVKLPEEPATTKVENYSVQKDFDDAQAAERKLKTIDDIDFIIADYYVFGKYYASIESVEMEDYGIGKIIGFANVKLEGINRATKEFKIAYKAYDAAGKVVLSSYILAAVDDAGYKKGETVQCRFDIPRDKGIVKVEFINFSEK